MGQVFWEASGTYAAKIDPKTPPPLIYQEIVPFQLEYKHSAIIWGIPLLNGFNGSVFLSELFGCHCFTNVCVVSFQTIWFFKWFWQQIHHCCYVWSHFQHMPEYVFTTEKWNFSDACMTQLDGCRVSGHTMATWFWMNWVFICLICLFCFFVLFYFLTVKIILKTIVAIG